MAKEFADQPTAFVQTSLGTFRRTERDLAIAQAAFGLEVGEVSDIVASQQGYHLIQVRGIHAGEDPADDRVEAHHIVAYYTPNQADRAQVLMKVNSGAVDLAFANSELKKLAPEQFAP